MDTLWSSINDLIIKTIISIDSITNSCIDMYVPYQSNCFDLIGFDILIDENLNPTVLEVNLSPSLASSSPLDAKIKTSLICDTLNLIGIKTNKNSEEI